jgi:hypothetical protein
MFGVHVVAASVLLSCMACTGRAPSRIVAPPVPNPMAFRWVEDGGRRVALLSCPADPDGACLRLASYDVTNDEHAGQAVSSPNRQRLAVQRIDAEHRCRVDLFDVDGTVSDDDPPGCNASNGDLLWIDDDHLWVSGGAGTSVSFASLVSAGGTTLWNTVDIAIELAPSGRYAIVGSNSHGGVSINHVSVIDLGVLGGVALAALPVPERVGDQLAARWERDRVVFTWPGAAPTGIAVEAPGARGEVGRADLVDTWRPFAAD